MLGWVCGGGVVGVLFSKSPRGGPAGSWSLRRQAPFLNSLLMVCLFGVPDVGGVGCAGLWVAETLICKVVCDRVSLKSCSGAILDRWVWVVPGVSVD